MYQNAYESTSLDSFHKNQRWPRTWWKESRCVLTSSLPKTSSFLQGARVTLCQRNSYSKLSRRCTTSIMALICPSLLTQRELQRNASSGGASILILIFGPPETTILVSNFRRRRFSCLLSLKSRRKMVSNRSKCRLKFLRHRQSRN